MIITHVSVQFLLLDHRKQGELICVFARKKNEEGKKYKHEESKQEAKLIKIIALILQHNFPFLHILGSLSHADIIKA